jgi:DNA-binding transcriptional ArsR family regulator
MEKNKGAAKTGRADLERMARLMKVCGHPVRLKLLHALEGSAGGRPCVTELWRCIGEPQPVVSQHLAVLKRAGIVASRIEGNRRIYSIEDAWVKSLIGTLP